MVLAAALARLLAADDGNFKPVGTDLLPWLVLAVGSAMVFGNVVALVRPPPPGAKADDLRRAPLARTVLMIVVGFIGAVWSLASLLSG